jgi:hypothetical protein
MENESIVTMKRGADRSVSNLVTIGKDSVNLLRDLFLFLLAMMLVVFPSTFNNVLTKAGFEEGSFAGLTWRKKLDSSNSALNDAQMTINDLKKQLDETTKGLVEAQAKLNDPVLKDKLGKIEERGVKLDAVTTQVSNSVSNTIASNATYVERAQKSADTGAQWGVVYGYDGNLQQAQYEVTRAAELYKILNPNIYLRQGIYRSVSVVGNRDQAEQELPSVRQRRADAYIVNMTSWCPNAVKQNGYVECQ